MNETITSTHTVTRSGDAYRVTINVTISTEQVAHFAALARALEETLIQGSIASIAVLAIGAHVVTHSSALPPAWESPE